MCLPKIHIIYRNEKSFGQLFLSLNKYHDTIQSFWARFVYIHEIHDNELLSDIHFFMQGDRMNLCFSQYAAVILATIVHEQNWRSVNSMVFLWAKQVGNSGSEFIRFDLQGMSFLIL